MCDLAHQHACSSARAPDSGAACRKQERHDENPNEVRSMLIEVGLKKEHDRGEVSDHRPDKQVADEVPKVSAEECVSRRDPAATRRVNKSSRCVEKLCREK